MVGMRERWKRSSSCELPHVDLTASATVKTAYLKATMSYRLDSSWVRLGLGQVGLRGVKTSNRASVIASSLHPAHLPPRGLRERERERETKIRRLAPPRLALPKALRGG